MIYSMTAFARHETQLPEGNVVWEIRSVNHRYLEISFRLPEIFTQLEPLLREQLKAHLQRGKVDISLRYQSVSGAENQLSLNQHLVRQLMQAHAEITTMTQTTSTLDPADLLRWPGVLQASAIDTNTVRQAVLASFTQTLTDLTAMRKREGAALTAILTAQLDAMQKIIIELKPLLQQINVTQRDKIIARLTEAKINFDPARLEQELIFYAQKIDITEEVDRLATHINEVRKTVIQGNAVGRRLDFLMQELNREANTLGAKSVATETSQAAIALKILIDQMREQVQNIE